MTKFKPSFYLINADHQTITGSMHGHRSSTKLYGRMYQHRMIHHALQMGHQLTPQQYQLWLVEVTPNDRKISPLN